MQHLPSFINMATRTPPALRLPDEVLLKIFGLVEVLEYDTEAKLVMADRNDDTIADIQNCRLVCRKFRDLASEVLVRVVRVDIGRPSIAKLDEMSRHPGISKGVRSVRICQGIY